MRNAVFPQRGEIGAEGVGLDRIDEAEKRLTQVVALKPDDAAALNALAENPQLWNDSKAAQKVMRDRTLFRYHSNRTTARVAALFGPVMCIWFAVIAIAALPQIARHPEVLLALNPLYAISFMLHHGMIGFVTLGAVFLAVTGAHIESFNNRGCVALPDERDEIDEQDVEDVKINAREVSIPAQNAFLHSIIQHYHVDGQNGVLNPVGMLGQRLEADFHIIHGVRTRIQNTIRCVKELPLDVEDVVFTPFAAAKSAIGTSRP